VRNGKMEERMTNEKKEKNDKKNEIMRRRR